MREVYIPELTERFPKGYYGEDLTERYFPSDCRSDEDAIWDAMADDYENSLQGKWK